MTGKYTCLSNVSVGPPNVQVHLSNESKDKFT